MLVRAAIVPPLAVREAVHAVVRSAAVLGAAAEEPPGRKGLRGRIGRHRAEPSGPADATGLLDQVPVADMHLPIAGFGNLTTHDANRVLEAIKEDAVGWPAPVVRLAGGTALDFPGDWSVWAKVDGDADALLAVVRGVAHGVEKLGFFVDRRMFRPMLSVATVTRQTTGPFLQHVVDGLDAFRGEEWDVEVSLLKEVFVDGRTTRTEFERVVPRPPEDGTTGEADERR